MRQWLTQNFSLCLEPSQKAFDEQFYEEDENEKPVFEDDLDDIGECCVRTVCVMRIIPVKIIFSFVVGVAVISKDEKHEHSWLNHVTLSCKGKKNQNSTYLSVARQV